MKKHPLFFCVILSVALAGSTLAQTSAKPAAQEKPKTTEMKKEDAKTLHDAVKSPEPKKEEASMKAGEKKAEASMKADEKKVEHTMKAGEKKEMPAKMKGKKHAEKKEVENKAEKKEETPKK